MGRGWVAMTLLLAALGCRTSAVRQWHEAPLAPVIAFTERVPPRGIVVLALDAHSGKPVDRAVLSVARMGDWSTARLARADSAGVARLVDLPTGQHQVRVSALGYQARSTTLDITDSVGVALVVQLRRYVAPNPTRMQTNVILKRFEQPDEVRELVKGRFELVRLGGLTIGRATYEPGWCWSKHVGPSVGQERCSVQHVGLVLSGTATAGFADGRVVELRAGQLFYIPPEPHDSWVVGDEPYVSLHFLGADHYAR